jgi:hypothetical protein
MFRAAKERLRTLRKWRENRRIVGGDGDEQVGRFRKGKVYGCRRANCGLCQAHKHPRELSVQEQREALDETDA